MKSLTEGLNDFYAAQTASDTPLSPGLMIETNGHKAARKRRMISLKVHPEQRQEAIDDARAKGVPTDFDLAGRPQFSGRRHQRDYNRAYGFFNRDGGYGD